MNTHIQSENQLVSEILTLIEEFPLIGTDTAALLLSTTEEIISGILLKMADCDLLSIQISESGTLVFERV